MKKFSALLGAMSCLICISPASARICFLADTQCQDGLSKLNYSNDTQEPCSEQAKTQTTWVKEKCIEKSWTQACRDGFSTYYTSTGCASAYCDMETLASDYKAKAGSSAKFPYRCSSKTACSDDCCLAPTCSGSYTAEYCASVNAEPDGAPCYAVTKKMIKDGSQCTLGGDAKYQTCICGGTYTLTYSDVSKYLTCGKICTAKPSGTEYADPSSCNCGNGYTYSSSEPSCGSGMVFSGTPESYAFNNGYCVKYTCVTATCTSSDNTATVEYWTSSSRTCTASVDNCTALGYTQTLSAGIKACANGKTAYICPFDENYGYCPGD